MFGKKLTPDEVVKKWKHELTKEERTLERTIRGIEQEENKVKVEIKNLAKKGDKNNVKTLAKELIRSRKAKEKLYNSKAQLHSVSLQLTSNLAMLKMGRTLAKSTQVMAYMNQLVRLPQLNKIMMAMAREMEKAGMIEEMIDDVMEDPDVEEEAETEVDKVIDEITMGLKTAPVVNNKLPQNVEKTAEEEDLAKRLDALKS